MQTATDYTHTHLTAATTPFPEINRWLRLVSAPAVCGAWEGGETLSVYLRQTDQVQVDSRVNPRPDVP